jgi:Putative Flp pilus-assembly TadE/G-like
MTTHPNPMTKHTASKCWWVDDRGLTGVAATFMLLVALAGGGLVYDGGRALGARRDAINNAEAAARAGAAEVGFDGLVAVEARAAVVDHLTRQGVAAEDIASIEIDATTVTVTVIARRPAAFAALLGNDTLIVRGVGTATASFGDTP